MLEIIKEGWPNQKRLLPENLKPFWNCRDEITEHKGVLLRKQRIIIPKALQKGILNRLHYAHLGITKTLAKAEESVYWPFMTVDIKNLISNCHTCISTTIINRQLPIRPWQMVAADIFKIKGFYCLLIVDMYSKFPELLTLKDLTSETTISVTKSTFSRYGKPNVLYTDNGSQFVNKHFQNFLAEWEVTHKTSSPPYAQSNGFIEGHIQTIKKLIKKTIEDNRDIHLALLEYITTPIDSNFPSPAELLYERKIKGLVPVTENLLKPNCCVRNVNRI